MNENNADNIAVSVLKSKLKDTRDKHSFHVRQRDKYAELAEMHKGKGLHYADQVQQLTDALRALGVRDGQE